MGWRSTMRTVAAAARAAERDAQRRYKEALRQEMIGHASAAVDAWENRLSEITSLHTTLVEEVDWLSIAATRAPTPPSMQHRHRREAEQKLAEFRPSILHALSGGSEKRRKALEASLTAASQKDDEEFARLTSTHSEALAEWQEDIQRAKRVVEGDIDAYKEVIAEMKSLTDHGLIGTAISFTISSQHIHAMPEVHLDEIVPRFRRKQLASGKLSETSMPVSQFNELYQDYVSSVALKVAGDLMQVLPLSEVFVTCIARMLNPSTGRQERTPVLSVQVVRETLQRIDLKNADPSECLRNFNARMDYKKTRGFSAIEPLKPIGLELIA